MDLPAMRLLRTACTRPIRPCSQSFLIFGKSGWIGGLVGDLLKEQGAKFEYANCRLEDRAAIIAELDRVRHAGRGGHAATAPRADRR